MNFVSGGSDLFYLQLLLRSLWIFLHEYWVFKNDTFAIWGKHPRNLFGKLRTSEESTNHSVSRLLYSPTDSGLELQYFQPPATSAHFRLVPTILIGKNQVLNTYPFAPVCPEVSGFCILTNSLVCLKATGESVSNQGPLCSVLKWVFPPVAWLVPILMLLNVWSYVIIPPPRFSLTVEYIV